MNENIMGIRNLPNVNDNMLPEYDAEQKLETIFFSILDALRGVWDNTNAANVLLSLIFYKRILSLVEEKELPFINIPVEDKELIEQARALWLTDKPSAVQHLRQALIQISIRNYALNNLFTPLVEALDQEEEQQHLLQVILMLDDLDFSSSSFSIRAFGTFFNNSLYRIASRAGKAGRERTTPPYINQLLGELARPKEKEIVYDPAAGQGSTMIEMYRREKRLHFVGQERDMNAYAFCRMNMLMNGIYDVDIHHTNALKHPVYAYGGWADIAVANFPFGLDFDAKDAKGLPYLAMPFEVTSTTKLEGNSLFIQLMLHQLKSHGRMFVVLPLRSLYKHNEERKLREYLLVRDWLEAVITLPYGLLYSTTSPFCILAINKQKSQNRVGKVLFINGANLEVENKSRLQRELRPRHIECITRAFHDDDWSCTHELANSIDYVLNKTIIENNFNLNAKRYAAPYLKELKRLEQEHRLVKLSEIFGDDAASVWYDSSFAGHNNLPYVKADCLAKSFTDYYLNTDSLLHTEQGKEIEGRVVNESVLLVNKNGAKLMVSFFEYKNEPIVVHQDVLIFKVLRNRIRIEYLLLQLHSNLFLQQLVTFKTDHSEPTISHNEFGQLQIGLPPLEEQEKAIRETKIQLLQAEEQKVETLRNRLNLDKQKAQNDQYRIISSLQHELGNRLPTVLTEIKNLRDFLDDKISYGESLKWNEPIFPVFEDEDPNDVDNLKMVVERIERTLSYAIGTIDAAGSIIKADKSRLRLERVLLKDFLLDLRKNYMHETRFSVQVEVEEDINGVEIPIYADIDQAQMATAFTNLIENAKRHGFLEEKKYLVRFKLALSEDKKDIIIEYKNDGKSFPQSFSLEHFISYGNYAGDTGHSGVGGFLIYQIMDNHNGALYLRENIDRDDPFKVQFEIVLPNTINV